MNEQNVKNKDIKWWMPEYGFFGKFYMDGDDSFDGYLAEKNSPYPKEHRQRYMVLSIFLV